MQAFEARLLGQQAASLIAAGRPDQACARLAPVLAAKTAFRLLDTIGAAIGAVEINRVDPFLKALATEKRMGGWVIIGSALGQYLERDLAGTLERCRGFIRAAEAWYAADSLGERVPGPALVQAFAPALTCLDAWRWDSNQWVRRVVGVAIHFWAKRRRGAAASQLQAAELLEFIQPMVGEREVEAVKGVGWGLKTLGRYYPGLATDWLILQTANPERGYRPLMLRKALAYLAPEQRARVMGRQG